MIDKYVYYYFLLLIYILAVFYNANSILLTFIFTESTIFTFIISHLEKAYLYIMFFSFAPFNRNKQFNVVNTFFTTDIYV